MTIRCSPPTGGRTINRQRRSTIHQPRPTNPARWSALHDIRVVWHARRHYQVRNLTSGDVWPRRFYSQAEAERWADDLLCRGPDPFDGHGGVVAAVGRGRGTADTREVAAVLGEPTAQARVRLNAAARLGLVRAFHRKGGAKCWKLTPHGENVGARYERRARVQSSEFRVEG